MKKSIKLKAKMQKVVVITGGTSGIGAELVEIYKKSKDVVCVLAKDRPAQNSDFWIENFYECDISNEESVKRAMTDISAKHKKIDLLINCAGYGLAGAIELTPSVDAEKQFATNMMGTFYVNKSALPYMKRGSAIINISSACALFALPYRGFYCASKSAVDMFSRCLNMELSKSGIKVISVCPGDVKTNFSKNRVKVFATNERYGNRIKNSIQKVEGNQEKRMSPTFVANKIAQFAEKKSPKPMYIIGAKYKFLYLANRILPQRVMLYFTKKMFD